MTKQLSISNVKAEELPKQNLPDPRVATLDA